MARGSKSSYTNKQKRMASHIEKSVKEEGGSEKKAERIAWATVNKKTGGGKKGKSAAKRSTSSTTKKSASSSSKSTSAKRSAAAKKGWETRRKNSN